MAPNPIVPVRVDPERKARWVAAAAAGGKKLSEWIRDAADAAAARVDAAGGRGGSSDASDDPGAPARPQEPGEQKSTQSGGPGSGSPASASAGPAQRTFRGPDPKPVGKTGRR